MIYTIGGQKGGCGKTTVAVNLAIYLSSQGRDVMLIDADDQESASDFTALREDNTNNNAGYTAIQLTGVNVLKQVPKLSERYQDIIIDTGGRDTDSQRAALTVTHIYLVPFVPGSLDIWTLQKVESLVQQASIANPKLQAFSFINIGYPRGNDNQDAAKILMDSQVLTFLDAHIVKRKAYANAIAAGLGIFELDSKKIDEKACSEFKSLIEQIENNLVVA